MTILADLLIKNRKFSPTFHPKVLSNHLSMALIALDKLGASSVQLKEYYETYSSELEPEPPLSNTIIIDDSNWINYLGHDGYYQNYLLFFKSSLQLIGIGNTLQKYLQPLIKGISGQAFHCLIRLAYALEIQDKDEIAVSLAFFSCHYLVLTEKRNQSPISNNPKQILNKINTSNQLSGIPISGINITEILKKVVSIPAFDPVIDWLEIKNNMLTEIAALLINLYAATKDFIALHMVTATHAMRIITPYLKDRKEALSYYWQSICAAYVAIGSPSVSAHSPIIDKFSYEKISWPLIFTKATTATDEHVIKLVYTCYQEHSIYQNPLYGYIAVDAVSKL